MSHDGPNNIASSPVNTKVQAPQTEDVPAPTGTTGDQRVVTTVAGTPTKGLRANAGESQAPTTSLAERTVRVHPFKAFLNSVFNTVKNWFRRPVVERQNQTAESLFQAQQNTGADRNCSDTHITADTNTPKLSELLKNAPKINGKPSISSVDFSNCQFDLKDLSDVHFSNCSFQKADLSGCFLENTSFSGCNFDNANLKGVQGDQVHFTHCDMNQTDLSECKLNNPRFEENSLNKAKFEKATLTNPIMTDGNSEKMKHCDFRMALIKDGTAPNLLNSGSSFRGAWLGEIKVGHMHLNSNYNGATLVNIQSQSGSIAHNSRINTLTMEGGDLRFGSVQNEPGVQCTFYNSTFKNTKVHANGNRVNMTNTNFQTADLSSASFEQGTWEKVRFEKDCNMQGMKTRGMEIKDSSFQNCDMRNSSHSGNGIYRCTFLTSNMDGCSFRYLPNSNQGILSDSRFESITGMPDALLTRKPKGITVRRVGISNCSSTGNPSETVSYPSISN